MKLILHIGTHKTGTTAIQRAFSSCSSSLINKGIWYPKYSEILDGVSDHYAHLDVAKGMMGQSKRLDIKQVKKFFEILYIKAAANPSVHTVFLSAEPFFRGQLGDSAKKWVRTETFLESLSEMISFEHVEIILVLRPYIDYIESLFNEHVRVSNYSKDILHFFEDFRERFNYKMHIELWEKHVGKVRVLYFDELIKKRKGVKWLVL